MSLSPDLHEIARRVIWFEEPEAALADVPRFLAYAMRYASIADMAVIRGELGDDVLRDALRVMPPGIIDGRSWSYWHTILGQFPPPPLPVRHLGGTVRH